MRSRFLVRMDAICGMASTPEHSYFAYGSNLLDSEMKRSAPAAKPIGRAYIPSYRLVFDKHSTTRRSDAASITRDSAAMVWGFVYNVDQKGCAELRRREGGYSELSVTAFLNSVGDEASAPMKVFTFVSDAACPKACGPSAEYVDLVLRGGEQRGLPADYILRIRSAAGLD